MNKLFINLVKPILILILTIGVCMQIEANDNLLLMELKSGNVTIEMKPEIAPNHVKRIKQLVREKFYDGLKFHRVIDGFMAQTGDPLGNGTGGSGQNIDAEFSSAKHIKGTVSMARARDPNSADSQFFICLADVPHLDEQYTIWGQVIEGMENVDKIKKGEGNNGAVIGEPDIIISLKLKSEKE
ncbi:MAG: putative peptidyl-prolyl cis-trans isomerase [Alphaproteobacteria bacterium MarineAlpha9_Bin2]|nr:MAG: putative peptidyl-prolyl cis-trans isomerase [Alphaproteobacteria bacterium MarineAlpha9_Bin2]